MKPTHKFFMTTFILSWLLWLPTVINDQVVKMPSVLLLLGMFANLIPSIIGLMMIKKERGTDFKAYIKSKLSFSFQKIYLLMLILFPLQAYITLLMTKRLVPSFEVVNPIPYMMFPLVFLQILFVGGALGEEFGWRGYAQEKLEARYGVIGGTLFLGFIWSLWHLPLFFMTHTVQANIPLWQFLIQNTTLAFFYAWFYKKTKGNILFMILLHAVLNTSAAIFPYWQSEVGRYLGLIMLLMMLIGIGLFEIIKKKALD